MKSLSDSKEYLINDCCHKILEYLYNHTRIVKANITYNAVTETGSDEVVFLDTYLFVYVSEFENTIGCSKIIFELALKTLKSNNHIDALQTNGKIDRVGLVKNDEIFKSGKAAFEIEHYLKLNRNKEKEEKDRNAIKWRGWIAIVTSSLAFAISAIQLVLKLLE